MKITVQSLIPHEIRPVIKHSAHLSKRGCSDASETFAKFAYTSLSDASVFSDSFVFEDFSACEFLPQLQQLLYSTNEINTSVTYETFVRVPENITFSLHEKFGNETKIDGPFVSSFSPSLPCLFSIMRALSLTFFLVPYKATGSLWVFVITSFLLILSRCIHY